MTMTYDLYRLDEANGNEFLGYTNTLRAAKEEARRWWEFFDKKAVIAIERTHRYADGSVCCKASWLCGKVVPFANINNA